MKKYFVFILLGFLATSLLLIRLLPKKPTSPGAGLEAAPSWQEVIPGETTTNELYSLLGQPIDISGKTHLYPSTTQFRPHEVIVEKGKVGLIKEKIIGKEKNLFDFTSEMGEPETILYGPDSVAGFYLHLFLKNGLAVLANPIKGTVLEVWYFPPTSLSEFMREWGVGYSQSLPRQY